ncbi:DNA repair protein RecO [Candidatus Saccharibacteria bacterium]|nr:DNA repair protein RecO [Candidatus Saccharibacteria bacterium]
MSTNTAPTKDIRTNGIILRRTNYGEADRILNILTPNGKITAIARSVRKTRSKLAGSIEMFSLIDFNIHQGRSEMGVVTGAKMLEYYNQIITDFDRMELMSVILKRVSRAAEHSDSPDFFNITKQCLQELNNATNLELTEGWFLLNLMRASGEEVNLYRDTAGSKLTIDTRYNWDPASESFTRHEQGEYDSDDIKVLRLMTTTSLKTTRKIKAPTSIYSKLLNLIRAASHI